MYHIENIHVKGAYWYGIDLKGPSSNIVFNNVEVSNNIHPDEDWSYGLVIAGTNGIVENISDVVQLTNFPNPFNSFTTIYINNQKDMNVKLAIFDIKGQKVKTLLENHRAKANTKIVWNGTNDANQKLISGHYFVVLRYAKTTVVNKMMLIR